MSVPMILAANDQMSAFLGSGFFKSLITGALVIIALMWLVAPTVATMLKNKFTAFISAQLKSLLGLEANASVPSISALLTPKADPAAPVTVQIAPDINKVVTERAAELKAACPMAPSDLLLKWLSQGYDSSKAQADYISVLEAKISSGTGTVPSATTSSSPTA